VSLFVVRSHLLTFSLQSSGVLVGGNSNGNCPTQAAPQCPARRRRDYDDQKTDDWKPTPSWSPDPYPSWSNPPTPTTWSKPTQSWSKPPHSWSEPNPSPSPWNPQPPKKQPCPYTCPQKNLAGGALTDEAIRDQYLFCRYPSKSCEQCGFCKYSTVSLQPYMHQRLPLTSSTPENWCSNRGQRRRQLSQEGPARSPLGPSQRLRMLVGLNLVKCFPFLPPLSCYRFPRVQCWSTHQNKSYIRHKNRNIQRNLTAVTPVLGESSQVPGHVALAPPVSQAVFKLL